MAEHEKGTGVLPIANIAAAIALLSGAVLYLAPLTSSRPNVEPGHDGSAWAPQDVEARLWQDPLEVTNTYQTALASKFTSLRGQEHTLGEVVGELSSITAHHTTEAKSPVVLAVMVPGGSFEEQVERRLRARHAVVEGLSSSQFAPQDYLHLGYFSLDWPIDADDLPKLPLDGQAPQNIKTNRLLVPYERYRQGFSSEADLLVFWLRDDAFADAPLSRLGELFRLLHAPDAKQSALSAAVVGPASSNDLAMMWRDELSPSLKGELAETTIYSAFASASESDLHSTADDRGSCLSEYLEANIPGFHFQRTVSTDDQLMKALIEELKSREISASAGGRIVLLAELDTLYGRKLPQAFAAQLAAQQPKNEPGTRRLSIETYFYPQGIDGKVPTDHKPDASGKAAAPPDRDTHRPNEAPEGADQSDYIRRLADQLHREDSDARWRDEGGIRAVGILGADVFDKIVLLRALRSALPDTVFFTNNLDARLHQPSEWDATHNLLVASSFGLAPRRRATQHDTREGYTPFRDSYQMAAYTATRLAIDPPRSRYSPTVHLYEIGLAGPVRLDRQERNTVLGWVKPRAACLVLMVATFAALAMLGVGRWRGDIEPSSFRIPSLRSVLTNTYTFLIVASGVIVVLFIGVQQLPGPVPEPSVLLSGVSIWGSEGIRLMVILLGIHFVWKATRAIDTNTQELERRYHLGNDSTPTSEPDRSTTAPGASGDGGHSLAQRFVRSVATAARRGAVVLVNCVKGSGQWNDPSTSAIPPGDKVEVKVIWHQYVRDGAFSERVYRILLPGLTYFGFAFFLMMSLGLPLTPARGPLAAEVNFPVTMMAVGTMIFVLFFVVDAAVLNRRFIRRLTHPKSIWPKELLDRCRPQFTCRRIDECLAELLDIKFIAARTAVIGPLIYYPFFLVTLMIISRLHYFDNWDFPLSLLIVFSLNTALAVFAAATTRRSAEYARGRAIANLRGLLFEATILKEAPPEERPTAPVTWRRGRLAALLFGAAATDAQADESNTSPAGDDADAQRHASQLIAAAQQALKEIEEIHTGAFGPWSENPVVGALLLPGSAGLLAIAQSLLGSH